MKMENLFGLAAEFESHVDLLRAAEKAHAQGYRKMDAYAPFPVDGLAEALGKHNRVPLMVLLGGIIGGAGAYYMQWYANLVSYPINIGGRPMHSWPAFIPITFIFRIACHQRSAETVSPDVQPSPIRTRIAGQILSLHRSARCRV